MTSEQGFQRLVLTVQTSSLSAAQPGVDREKRKGHKRIPRSALSLFLFTLLGPECREEQASVLGKVVEPSIKGQRSLSYDTEEPTVIQQYLLR